MAESRLAFDAEDEVLAAAAWSRLAEPGDDAAAALVHALGPVGALAWAAGGDPSPPAPPADPAAWGRARERWRPRLERLDPRRELDVLARLDGRLVRPGDPEWPPGLDDLGSRRPPCLWVRGRPLRPASDRSVALVGSRACTAYGLHVAGELAVGLADRGITVVSGGAYGIDAAAHRGVLAVRGTTVAVLAGGVDRLYPAGNTELLTAVLDAGSLVAESPPGSAPMRSRFLLRNRLIAAMSQGTVVVEAAWRSGALSTATHAAHLLRPLGAVPGPVTSVTSAGCHRLLREAGAVCVTDAADVVELVEAIGTGLADEPDGPDPAGSGSTPVGLEARERAVLEAVPLRGRAGAESIARAAGRSVADVEVSLAYLELAGLVAAEGRRWRRSPA